MNLFYTSNIKNNKAFLDESESRHCSKVLRMKNGDDIFFIDGAGGFYRGKLLNSAASECEIEIQEKQENYEKRPYYLHIAISPTKNSDRFEWFLEKAAEIGVDKISPIICEHSERKKIREDRYKRIILSAVKQSVKAWIPKLEPLKSFDEFLKSVPPETDKFIAHCIKSEKWELLKEAGKSDSFLLLIGPEGDFSCQELEKALKHDFKPVSLGKSRLRTETAGVAAAQIIADAMSLKK
ncbi:MAG: 16S rRNA (uracil(1498)-N(3))-methyltransferase [Bacteroidota bacterium]